MLGICRGLHFILALLGTGTHIGCSAGTLPTGRGLLGIRGSTFSRLDDADMGIAFQQQPSEVRNRVRDGHGASVVHRFESTFRVEGDSVSVNSPRRSDSRSRRQEAKEL